MRSRVCEEAAAIGRRAAQRPRKPEGYRRVGQRPMSMRQRQPGYATVTVTLPLGDLIVRSDAQAGRYGRTSMLPITPARPSIRTSCCGGCSTNKLPALYQRSEGHRPRRRRRRHDRRRRPAAPAPTPASSASPSSRGLAGELRTRLAAQNATLDEAIRNLHIKVSGCFNSCGQHHVADIGFYGNSRNVGGYTVPHFQVMIGGSWTENGGTYGLAIGSIPSKAHPDRRRATHRPLRERATSERNLPGFLHAASARRS